MPGSPISWPGAACSSSFRGRPWYSRRHDSRTYRQNAGARLDAAPAFCHIIPLRTDVDAGTTRVVPSSRPVSAHQSDVHLLMHQTYISQCVRRTSDTSSDVHLIRMKTRVGEGMRAVSSPDGGAAGRRAVKPQGDGGRRLTKSASGALNGVEKLHFAKKSIPLHRHGPPLTATRAGNKEVRTHGLS